MRLVYLALAAPLVVSLILHVPSLPPFLGNWGFKYSDIASVAYSVIQSPDRWFDHGKYLDFAARRGCHLPYVDYHFEYPPLVGLLWAFSTCLSGWDLDLHLYIHAGAIAAGYAGLLWALSKLAKRRLWLLAASPSLYLYAVYNWDVLAASLALVGVVYVRSRPLLAGLIHGLAFNVKWIAAGVAYYYGVALWGQKEWRRYAAGAVLGAVAPMAALYLLAPGGFWQMINHHARWYCENCLYLFAVGDLHSPLHKYIFAAVVGFVVALLTVLGRRIEERHALLGAAISLTVFNYVFSPQMFLLILPFGLMALSKTGLAVLWLADLANFGIMATWYYAEHPHVAGPPQTFAFYRNLLLLIIFAGIAAGAELRRPSFIYAKRLPWTYVGLAAVFAAFLYSAYSVASLPGADGMPGGQGYISDEVWYVASARNILHDVFRTPAASDYYTVSYECMTPGLFIVKTYQNMPGVYTAAGLPPCYIRRGFPYPDKEGILSYYNLEHPPLAKYVIAAVEAVRDEPIFWRLPSMALGAATLLLVFLTARKLAGGLWALVASALMLFDNTFRAMASIAMLDIYLAFFTALLAYFHLSRRLLATGAALGLAAAVKYSGAFPVFGLAYLYARRRESVASIAILAATVSVFLLASLPLISHFGLAKWVDQLIGAYKWHTTPRPPGPVASTPLDWLFMQNSFALHANPDISASGTPLYLLALLYALYKRDEASVLFLSVYGGYWLVYLAGNRTLYSFYTAHFSPLAHIVSAPAFAKLWSLARRAVQFLPNQHATT
jgi:predicted membrane-bound dolichyl-phosphate-mannose-protein mannosyltransferase